MTTWDSIEGETPIDPSSLKEPGSISTRSELAAAEAANINKTVLRYLAARPSRKTAPFDYEWLLQLHREMFGDVWLWAGRPRTSDLNLGVPHAQIVEQLASLADDLHSWSSFGHELAVQAAWLHHRAVRIHPFLNGNGRWARLLSNIWLRRNNAPLVYWPDPLIGNVSTVRVEYLAAIKAADAGNDAPLLGLHERFTSHE